MTRFDLLSRVYDGVDLGLVTVCLVKNYGKALAVCILAEAERRNVTVKALLQERLAMLNRLGEERVYEVLARRVVLAWLKWEPHALRRLDRVFRLRCEVWGEDEQKWPGVAYYLPEGNPRMFLAAVRTGEPFVLLEVSGEVICLGCGE